MADEDTSPAAVPDFTQASTGEESSGEPMQAVPPTEAASPLVAEPETVSSEPIEAPLADTQTAQMGRNEPLAEPAPLETEPTETEIPELASAESSGEAKPGSNFQAQSEPAPPVVISDFRNPIHEILAKAQIAIQNKKRKKLDRIMALFAKRTNITNSEVEKLLHVSDATATRYLSILEKEGKIRQVGKTGTGVVYVKV